MLPPPLQDPKNMDAYLANNIFLPDINNEHASKNAAYADNLAALERLVLLRFTNDTTGEAGALGPVHQQVPSSICTCMNT